MKGVTVITESIYTAVKIRVFAHVTTAAHSCLQTLQLLEIHCKVIYRNKKYNPVHVYVQQSYMYMHLVAVYSVYTPGRHKITNVAKKLAAWGLTT